MSASKRAELYAGCAPSLLVRKKPGQLVHRQPSKARGDQPCSRCCGDRCPLFRCTCPRSGEREETNFLSSTQMSPLYSPHMAWAAQVRKSPVLCAEASQSSVALDKLKHRFGYLTNYFLSYIKSTFHPLKMALMFFF